MILKLLFPRASSWNIRNIRHISIRFGSGEDGEGVECGDWGLFSYLDTFRRDVLAVRLDSGFGLALLVKDLGITK
jgi:hypothetical protein